MSEPRRVVITDTETTSLTPDYQTGAGVIWEAAFIERATGAQRVYLMKPDVSLADPEALKVGQFAERTASTRHPDANEEAGRRTMVYPGEPGPLNVWNRAGGGRNFWSDPADVAALLASYLSGVILVAANPAFDAGFMSALLAHYGHNPQPWHYRLRDIGSMAWGYLSCGFNVPVPPIDASTDEFARALHVDPASFIRHTALGDCLLGNAMLNVIESGDPA